MAGAVRYNRRAVRGVPERQRCFRRTDRGRADHRSRQRIRRGASPLSQRIDLRRLIFAALAFLVLAVAPARAQLTIEIVGGAGTTVPIAIVPFENESNWPLGISGIVAADLQRSGLFRQVSEAGIVPRPSRAEDVKFGDFRARGADAVVVGSMRPLARRSRGGALRAARRGQADAAGRDDVRGHATAVPRDGAQDRRRDLREAHRRRRRVLDAHRVHHQAGRALRAHRRRCRRRQSAGDRRLERAAALAVVVAGRLADRLRVAGEQEARHLRPVDGDRAAAGAREFPRQQQRARVVAGRPPARRDADQGRRLADLPHQRRRHRRAAPSHLGRHRHRGLVHAGRQGAAVLLRSRRHAADLPADDRDAAPSSG